MKELIKAWDGEFVVTRYDEPTGAWMFIAIHDRTLGMAMGGCRLNLYTAPEDGLRDVLRLARGMTFKWAAIDFPFGGGKAVLAVPRPLEPDLREELLLRFGDLVESLGGLYGTHVDLGTTVEDMDVVGRRSRWAYGRTDHSGAGATGPWTALGVKAGLLAACQHAFGEATLAGRTVLVQGVGSVGEPLARLLADAEARPILTDAMPGRAEQLADEIGADTVAPELTYETPCDVFAPCAIGAVLNARSIPRLRCRVVGGSANNVLESDADAALLHERGILYAPDFVINAGGAIAHGALKVLQWSERRAHDRVDGIYDMLDEIFGEAAERRESPLDEAIRRADRILERARGERQRSDSLQPA